MFGIELSTGTKWQIALVVAILGTAGVMLLHNSKKQLNDAVSSWVTPEKHLLAGSKTAWDPVQERTNNTFSCADGKLQIIEYKNDPNRRPTIKWAIDPLRTEFIYYRDPMARVKSIKDPFKHAIALASYSAANGASLGFLGGAGLNPEQLAAEKDARELMNAQLKLIAGQIENGTFKSDLFNKVLQVLAAYKRAPGNPDKDSSKADAARKVIQTAQDYLNEIDDARSADIEKYIAKISSLLTADQKQKVADAGKKYEDAKNTKNAGTVRRTVPATPGTTGTAPARNNPPRTVTPNTPRPGPTRTVTPVTPNGRGGAATPAPTRVAPPSPGAG